MWYKKYFLDLNDLQFKQVRLPWKKKLSRLMIWFAGSIVISVIYSSIFGKIFGSPEEKILRQEIENLKFQFSLAGRQIDNLNSVLNSLRMSDEILYRPVLSMDSLPESYKNPGVGGVDWNEDLYGYENTQMMINFRKRLEEVKTRTLFQTESFMEIIERSNEYEKENAHIPWICPVKVTIRRGDGMKFRDKHPVLGTPKWHYGQDFSAPYGSEVFATGAGIVIEAGWNSGGFGNFVVIDHGFGYRTTYGHLSSIYVKKGLEVKRGHLLGLSGNSGTSSGPHLHYQIDLFGQHKNPLEFFDDDLTEEEYAEMIETLNSGIKFK
jgi:murein DD-endopeptidase MepM/ murein hydrolase activator NlpD